jgi:hypothetical protein
MTAMKMRLAAAALGAFGLLGTAEQLLRLSKLDLAASATTMTKAFNL